MKSESILIIITIFTILVILYRNCQCNWHAYDEDLTDYCLLPFYQHQFPTGKSLSPYFLLPTADCLLPTSDCLLPTVVLRSTTLRIFACFVFQKSPHFSSAHQNVTYIRYNTLTVKKKMLNSKKIARTDHITVSYFHGTVGRKHS